MVAEEEEWPSVITDEKETEHQEYGRVSEAVGELTSAVLDCQTKELMEPRILVQLRKFLQGILTALE